jgi:carbon-monoxide dehydrogenase large subunit
MAELHLAVPRFVGHSVGRKENRRFLTGRGLFLDDIVLPGMLHAAILRSTLARGRILSIDVSEAKALTGVWAVYSADDINHQFKPLKNIFGGVDPVGKDIVLAVDEVSFVGDPVAIVVAEDRYIAEDALELIVVDYEPLDHACTIDAVRASGPILPGKDSNLAFSLKTSLPGAIEAFKGAAHVVSHTIAQGRVVPTPIETRGIICNARMAGKLEVHMTSQNPHRARSYLAAMLGIGEHAVRVISPDVGGAFGQKYCFGRDLLSVVGAARKLGRPVKWIEDRSEALQAGGFGRSERVKLDLAFTDQGIITASRILYEDTCGAEPMIPPSTSANLTVLMHTGAYAVATMQAEVNVWFANTGGSIPYRGPWASETLIREAAMDKAARQLGIDPVELRRRNIITKWPHKLPLGPQIDELTARESLDKAIEILGYEQFREQQRAAREQGRYLGLGISLCIEPTAVSAGANSTDTVELRLEPSGTVTAVMTCHSQGHSVETTMAQVIADELGVDVEDVSIVFGDTDAIGFGAGAGGSRQAVVSGGAAIIAATQLRDKMLKLAGHLLKTPAQDLRLEGGKVMGKGACGPSITYAELGTAAHLNLSSLPEGMEPSLAARSCYAAPMYTFANACHLSVVEVDHRTGLVKVLRYIVVEDCGVMLNPAVVEGQVSGGVVQGIGNALWEEQHYDEGGNPGATTFKDYAMPLCTDIPLIEFAHLRTPSNTPTGAKGVGEGGAIVGTSCIYNAVADALACFEAELSQLPLTPARILSSIKTNCRLPGP